MWPSLHSFKYHGQVLSQNARSWQNDDGRSIVRPVGFGLNAVIGGSASQSSTSRVANGRSELNLLNAATSMNGDKTPQPVIGRSIAGEGCNKF